MKVALLTFHNALNYGAALQAYAAQEAIKNLGVDCMIIDYVNEHRKDAYNMFAHAKKEWKHKKLVSAFKYLAGWIFMQKRRRGFVKFYNDYLTCTETSFASSKEAKALNGQFDKFIVGSDQVWNYINNGQDCAYFLDFVDDDSRKISYSSSFGISAIPENLKKIYYQNLLRIAHLSTREQYGVDLLMELTGRKAKLVLDPVFLLNKQQWLSLCGKSGEKKSYIFCYINRPGQLTDFLEQTKFPVDNMKIHKITRHLTIRDFISPNVKVSYSISPIEFIKSIAESQLVVTASFHCIAMSIILNVPFVAVLTGDAGKDERVLNILRITGLENRILNENMTLTDVNRPIDFVAVEGKIQEYRNQSLDFLKQAIFS